jgi:DNA-binding NtrC family response regulator
VSSLAAPRTVLIIDDHTGCLRVTVDLLDILGYRALVASDAEQAEALFADHQEIDLVMLDLFLGTTPGAAVAQRLEIRRAGLRVLFMSGYDKEACTTPELLGPRRHFIEKPFSLGALEAALTALLAGQAI